MTENMRRIPDLDTLRGRFAHWEVVKDLTDQLIDLQMNYRQSGHPGGSRSKVHLLVALLLSGSMRIDLRDVTKAYGDRFILGAGHTTPAVYALLAVLYEALRLKHAQTGDERYALAHEGRFALHAEDLLGFRNHGGLPGHAEMVGKTMFHKWNTGPSGHGLPAAVGEAFALRYVGADDVLVWGLDGEGGLSAGGAHEAKNSAWGLGLSNLHLLVDWNDHGIDPRPMSSVVHGDPKSWFEPHGWRCYGAESGNDWEGVAGMFAAMMNRRRHKEKIPLPVVGWVRTKKGRGYLKYDAASHGAPHKRNSSLFWETKRPFEERYGVDFVGKGPRSAAFANQEAIQAQYRANIDVVLGVLARDQGLIDALADHVVEMGDSVPEKPASVWVDFTRDPFDDEDLFDVARYPFYKPAGTRISNKMGMSEWGAWVNATCGERYGRPLVLAASADLAESTGLAGFGQGIAAADGEPGTKGWGWYERLKNRRGVVLPQEITEFVNAGLMAAMSSVNFDERPLERFSGFIGAASTYGAFSYLKYGMVRLFSQLAQDCELRVGKFLWIAGHSGPETAEDSRTHFGIFAPGVTQLLPRGQVINLHPWEYNEVPVLLGTAMRCAEPVIVLHLTRPAIAIPDREKLGIASHFEAAHGAYLIRDFDPALPPMGTILVQGTSSTNNLVSLLPTLAERGLNVKIIAALSFELFRQQADELRERVLPWSDWLDSMVITSGSVKNMGDWLSSKVAEEYSLSADWDDRWRSGGSVEEVVDEAHLSAPWLLAGIERFVAEREPRRARLKA